MLHPQRARPHDTRGCRSSNSAAGPPTDICRARRSTSPSTNRTIRGQYGSTATAQYARTSPASRARPATGSARNHATNGGNGPSNRSRSTRTCSGSVATSRANSSSSDGAQTCGTGVRKSGVYTVGTGTS